MLANLPLKVKMAQVFTRVRDHLLAQGKAAIDIHQNCYYRSGDLKCAIGVLIDDEFYSKKLEGQGVSTPEVVKALDKSGVLPHEPIERLYMITMLAALQQLHDTQLPKHWKSSLEEVKHRHRLGC